jgi:predicted nucleotidyltransferase
MISSSCPGWYTQNMGTVYRTLEYLERLQPGPGDREKALAEARAIAAYLKREYGAEVFGVGSLFVPGRNFTERSDIDLVARGLPAGRFFSILVKLDDMTSFKLDLVPFEDANEYMQKQALKEGVRL